MSTLTWDNPRLSTFVPTLASETHESLGAPQARRHPAHLRMESIAAPPRLCSHSNRVPPSRRHGRVYIRQVKMFRESRNVQRAILPFHRWNEQCVRRDDAEKNGSHPHHQRARGGLRRRWTTRTAPLACLVDASSRICAGRRGVTGSPPNVPRSDLPRPGNVGGCPALAASRSAALFHGRVGKGAEFNDCCSSPPLQPPAMVGCCSRSMRRSSAGRVRLCGSRRTKMWVSVRLAWAFPTTARRRGPRAARHPIPRLVSENERAHPRRAGRELRWHDQM